MSPLLHDHGSIVAICADADEKPQINVEVVNVPDPSRTITVRNGFAARPPNNPLLRQLRHVGQSFLFWPDRQKRWARAAVEQIDQVWRPECRNIVVTSGPRFSVHTEMLRWIRRSIKRVFWVMDLRDPWTNDPSPAMRRRSPSFLTRIEARMEAACHRRANLVTTVSNVMTEMMKRDFNSPAVTIYNGYPESIYQFPNRDRGYSSSGAIRILYLGTLIHGLRTPVLLFDAAHSLGIRAEQLSFEFWCNDPELVLTEAARYGVSHLVKCHSPVSLRESQFLQSEADVNLVLNGVDDGANHMITGKVFELIAAQRPIIAITGRKSELRHVLEQCGCDGLVWDLETARNCLLRVAQKKLSAVSDRNRAFSRTIAANKLLTAINQTVSVPEVIK